jgi:hypothetical protein
MISKTRFTFQWANIDTKKLCVYFTINSIHTLTQIEV